MSLAPPMDRDSSASSPCPSPKPRLFGGLRSKSSRDWLGMREPSKSRRPSEKRSASSGPSLLGLSVARIIPTLPASPQETSSAESTFIVSSSSAASEAAEVNVAVEVSAPVDEPSVEEEAERKRKEAKQLKSWLSKDALRRMLEEPRCLWKFGRFLSSEMSAEVLVFWLNAEQHRQDLERLHAFTRRVHSLHVPTSATLALNISHRERGEIEAASSAFLKTVDPFTAAREAALEALFRDSWPRFISHRLELAHQHGLSQLASRADTAASRFSKLAKCFCISSLTGDQVIELVSPGFAAVTGYSTAETVGRNCRFLQGPGTASEAVSRIKAAVIEGRPSHELLLNYTKSGNPFFNLLLTVPLLDSRGTPVATLGYQVDTTSLMSRAPNLARLLDDELDDDSEDASGFGSPFQRMQQDQTDAVIKARIGSQRPVTLRSVTTGEVLGKPSRRPSKVVHGADSATSVLSRDQRMQEASALAFGATAARQNGRPGSRGGPMLRPEAHRPSTTGPLPFGATSFGPRRQSASPPVGLGFTPSTPTTMATNDRPSTAGSVSSSPQGSTAQQMESVDAGAADQAAAVFVVLERDGLSVLHADPRLAPDITVGMRTTAAFRESGDLPQRLAQCARTGQSFVVSCQVRLGRLFEDKSAQPRQPILVAGNVVVDARERVGAVVVMINVGSATRMSALTSHMPSRPRASPLN